MKLLKLYKKTPPVLTSKESKNKEWYTYSKFKSHYCNAYDKQNELKTVKKGVFFKFLKLKKITSKYSLRATKTNKLNYFVRLFNMFLLTANKGYKIKLNTWFYSPADTLLNKTLLIFCLLFTTFFYSQSRRVADRYFKEYLYVRAAEMYKTLHDVKGDDSKQVLSKLADSYYNNANIEEAEIWYHKLFEKYKTELSDEHMFKYAQVLRSSGQYQKSDSILKTLKLLPDDVISSGLNSLEYISEYSKMKDRRISISNLAINTEFSDFGGFIIDGNAYYTSSAKNNSIKQKIYKRNNQPFLNIYKARVKIESLEWNEKDTVLSLHKPKVIEPPVTTKFHEGRPVFTKDGKTMYFTRNNYDGKRIGKDKNKIMSLKIYKANFVDGIWANVEELPFNSNNYSVGHPALGPDDKFLYFTSDMPGGYGTTDLYKVEIYAEDNYGVPQNLGNKINTKGREAFPFVGKDSTLYFSSDGHIGLGLLDIFQVKLEKYNGNEEVLNLGEPLNSNKDDFAFYINDKGKQGFFSSNREDGKGDDDIYSFFIYSVPTPCLSSISGSIIADKSNKNVPYATVSILNEKGEIIEEVLSDAEGKYNIPDIPCNNNYTVVTNKYNHDASQSSLTLSTIPLNNFDIYVSSLISDNMVNLKPIYFNLNKYNIRDDAKYELEKLYNVMVNNPELKIRIESHTDSWGKADYNLRLSKNRAISTRNYLVERGISSDRITKAEGFGESRLLNDCTDENQKKCSNADHQVNRRSYFIIVKGMEEMREKEEKERIKAIENIKARRANIKKIRQKK
ncbi:MAG: OmpA family protein [Tenacibaculum sp.]